MHPAAKLLIYLVLAVPAVYTGGWAVATLWQWFIVPLGAASLGVWHAAGLHVLVSTLTLRSNAATKDIGMSDFIAKSFVVPPLAVGFGWLLHLGV